MSQLPSRRRLVIVTAFGKDSPGLVAKITGRIAQHNGNIIDIEQDCRRGIFSIFLIVDVGQLAGDLAQFERDLKAIEETTALKVQVDRFEEGRRKIDVDRLSVVSLGKDRPGLLAHISEFYERKGVNIESTKMIARGDFFSMEMILDISDLCEDFVTFRGELQRAHAEVGLSVVIQKENIFHKTKKLIVFDVENTLLADKYIDAVAKELDLEIQASRINEQEREGNLSFKDALQARARLLKGMKMEALEQITENLVLTPGALELVEALKKMGFKIALISSGFTILTKKIFEHSRAGVDYAFANELIVDEHGVLTGTIQEPVIDESKKNELLEFIADVEGLAKEEIIAISDGQEEGIFLNQCGLSIAFKPDVAQSLVTDGILTSDNILNVLYCFGIPESQLDELEVREKPHDE